MPDCTHRWLLDPPVDMLVKGQCKCCGTQKIFNPYKIIPNPQSQPSLIGYFPSNTNYKPRSFNCAVEGCDRPTPVNGGRYCTAHKARLSRTGNLGSPQIGKYERSGSYNQYKDKQVTRKHSLVTTLYQQRLRELTAWGKVVTENERAV